VNVVSLNEVTVTGEVAISDVTACPARVKITVEGGDGCNQAGTDDVTIAVTTASRPPSP